MDRVSWDKKVLESTTLPSRQEGYTKITAQELVVDEKYFLVETFPDGHIEIRGQEGRKSLTIARFVLMKGREDVSSRIPESNWRSNTLVFEDPIVRAHGLPHIRRYIQKSEKKTYVSPPSGTYDD